MFLDISLLKAHILHFIRHVESSRPGFVVCFPKVTSKMRRLYAMEMANPEIESYLIQLFGRAVGRLRTRLVDRHQVGPPSWNTLFDGQRLVILSSFGRLDPIDATKL